MEPYDMPTFLDKRSVFIWGLTGRQVCLIAMGATFGYLFSDFNTLFGVLLFVVMLAIASAFAFIRVQQLDLENWLLVWLAYFTMPKVWLWHPLQIEEEAEDQKSIQAEEGADLW